MSRIISGRGISTTIVDGTVEGESRGRRNIFKVVDNA